MAEEKSMFQAVLEKAEKMTEAELHDHRRQYEPESPEYRAYDLEIRRRRAERMERMVRNSLLCLRIALAVSIAFFMALVWLIAKR